MFIIRVDLPQETQIHPSCGNIYLFSFISSGEFRPTVYSLCRNALNTDLHARLKLSVMRFPFFLVCDGVSV